MGRWLDRDEDRYIAMMESEEEVAFEDPLFIPEYLVS